ncbi:MAG: hypothetical protein KKF62_05185 [Bacteroidetes bacterium]|nr:hypothetical protein [Bacteroidota bacterium]MBU1117225.1 hypothetical protein [Bacteroidota bacterium]MBU1800289.1 hypothetical protein [Bacteroidota bacterium]
MRKNSLLVVFILLLFSCLTIYAQVEPTETSSGGGIDWFELIIITGYLLGVFILLPIVVYTNLKEKLFSPTNENSEEVQIIENLSEEERNNRAVSILEKIEEKLTPFTADNGENMITITSGKQARFVKEGLDYINKQLVPTNADVIARVEEFSTVYADRTQRAFTGSNWVIGCSLGVGILFFMTAGISTFIFIHFLGLVFYFLSSRTTMYTLEKRMKILGRSGGMISSILSGLFIGNGVKYYVKNSSGYVSRDWETEGQMAIIGLVILLIAAMILGFFAAFLGVINALLNYSTSYLLPIKPKGDWFETNISLS